LSKDEKGLGGTLADTIPVELGGGSGDSGSSMAKVDV
jgi:hypothetical protein